MESRRHVQWGENTSQPLSTCAEAGADKGKPREGESEAREHQGEVGSDRCRVMMGPSSLEIYESLIRNIFVGVGVMDIRVL